MLNMFDIVDSLCKRDHISVARMCREINMQPSIITDLKHKRTKNLSHANMLKIANFFHVSTDIFNEENNAESFHDKSDIKKEKPTANKGDEQTNDDPIIQEIIKKVKQLSFDKQERVAGYIDSLAPKDEKQN